MGLRFHAQERRGGDVRGLHGSREASAVTTMQAVPPVLFLVGAACPRTVEVLGCTYIDWYNLNFAAAYINDNFLWRQEMTMPAVFTTLIKF